jgi:hypothetical protein
MSHSLKYRLCAEPLDKVLWCFALLPLGPVQPSTFTDILVWSLLVSRQQQTHHHLLHLDGVNMYTAYEQTIQHIQFYSYFIWYDTIWYNMIYLLTAIGLSPGGSTYSHTNNTENNTNNRKTQITNNVEECGPCRVFASFILAFAWQLRKSTEKPQSVYFNIDSKTFI